MSLLLLFQGGTTAAGFRSLALELGIGASAGISLEAGSFTVSGQDAGLRRGFVLRADAGSYALDGDAATLLPQRRASAEAGSYSLSGQTAALRQDRTLRADADSYTLNGQDAGFQRVRTLVANAGSYSLSGQDAALTYGQFFGFRSLALELGAGAVTAAAISAEPGTFTVSGQAAALKRGLRLAAEAGSYTYTGVASQSDVVVSAAAGTYSVTGYDATLTKTSAAAAGFYSLALEIGAGGAISFPSISTGGGGGPADVSKRRKVKRSYVQNTAKQALYDLLSKLDVDRQTEITRIVAPLVDLPQEQAKKIVATASTGITELESLKKLHEDIEDLQRELKLRRENEQEYRTLRKISLELRQLVMEEEEIIELYSHSVSAEAMALLTVVGISV